MDFVGTRVGAKSSSASTQVTKSNKCWNNVVAVFHGPGVFVCGAGEVFDSDGDGDVDLYDVWRMWP